MPGGPPVPQAPRRELRARGAAGEEAEGVGELAVHEHFVMKVWAGRAAGGADVADDFAAANGLARGDHEARHMAVACRQAEPVVDHDHVSVVAVESGAVDRAVCRRVNGGAVLRRNVETW